MDPSKYVVLGGSVSHAASVKVTMVNMLNLIFITFFLVWLVRSIFYDGDLIGSHCFGHAFLLNLTHSLAWRPMAV